MSDTCLYLHPGAVELRNASKRLIPLLAKLSE